MWGERVGSPTNGTQFASAKRLLPQLYLLACFSVSHST